MDVAQELADGIQGEGAGLRDFFGKGWVKTPTGYWVKVAVHVFRTEQDVTAGGNGNELGNELDVTIGKDLESGLALQIGGGVFSPGTLTEDLVGDATASWVYAQGTVVF